MPGFLTEFGIRWTFYEKMARQYAHLDREAALVREGLEDAALSAPGRTE